MLRASLKIVSGTKARRDVMVGRGGLCDLPDPVALGLVPDGAGYALLRLDPHGASISHTWHPSIEAAKEAAAKAYGVASEDWS